MVVSISTSGMKLKHKQERFADQGFEDFKGMNSRAQGSQWEAPTNQYFRFQIVKTVN